MTYDNTNDDDPSTSSRTIIWQLFDGANYSSAGTTTVNITATNDIPTIAEALAPQRHLQREQPLSLITT